MSTGVQAFRLSEVKRAYKALQQMGVKISRVVLDGSRVEFVTDEGSTGKPRSTMTAEDVRKAL